ncbi:GFA family protein [Pseudodesulfovibrio tunisiensis]|uniref:GFA family protein n=1 Tax=Pseudodesulfovibrio tunisiensis TaxID=463192 RepID=UPI00311DB143
MNWEWFPTFGCSTSNRRIPHEPVFFGKRPGKAFSSTDQVMETNGTGGYVVKHSGACLCGRVRFEVDGVFESFYLCHCERCRKDTGSAHAANLFSASARLRWLSGEGCIRTFDFNSTGHVRSFCTVCGSALPNVQMDGALLVVPAGSLDTDVPIQPQGHIYCSRKANWDTALEAVPRFEELPEEE